MHPDGIDGRSVIIEAGSLALDVVISFNISRGRADWASETHSTTLGHFIFSMSPEIPMRSIKYC